MQKIKSAIKHLEGDRQTWLKLGRKHPEIRSTAVEEAKSDMKLIKKLRR